MTEAGVTVIQVQDAIIARLLKGNPASRHYNRTVRAARRYAKPLFEAMGYDEAQRLRLFRDASDMARLEREAG